MNPDKASTWKVHRIITLTMQGFLGVGVCLAVLQGRWLPAITTAGIMILTMLPLLLSKRFRVYIPPEFEVLAVMFIYASLFLGEVHGYYIRYWWWDALLHTGSGFLLGLMGFLLVHLLNEMENINLHMKPGFVALFSFMFAVGTGAIWEIFEFSMDQMFGFNMQKSGLVDTMWDLIVDTIGALTVSLLGWTYLRNSSQQSFLERWIHAFIEANPRLFQRSSRSSRQ